MAGLEKNCPIGSELANKWFWQIKKHNKSSVGFQWQKWKSAIRAKKQKISCFSKMYTLPLHKRNGKSSRSRLYYIKKRPDTANGFSGFFTYFINKFTLFSERKHPICRLSVCLLYLTPRYPIAPNKCGLFFRTCAPLPGW